MIVLDETLYLNSLLSAINYLKLFCPESQDAISWQLLRRSTLSVVLVMPVIDKTWLTKCSLSRKSSVFIFVTELCYDAL